MRRNLSSLLLFLSLAACDSLPVASECDAQCDQLKILARRGDASAQTALGRIYFNGTGIPKDEIKAVALWQQAADQDYAPAQNLLAQAYSCGVGGLKPDKEKAAELARKARDSGNAVAPSLLKTLQESDQQR